MILKREHNLDSRFFQQALDAMRRYDDTLCGRGGEFVKLVGGVQGRILIVVAIFLFSLLLFFNFIIVSLFVFV